MSYPDCSGAGVEPATSRRFRDGRSTEVSAAYATGET